LRGCSSILAARNRQQGAKAFNETNVIFKTTKKINDGFNVITKILALSRKFSHHATVKY